MKKENSPKQIALKKILKKQVHTSKMYIDVFKNDRELYETMLNNNFGVTSSLDLSIDELNRLLDFLNGKTNSIQRVYATSNQIAFIKTLWEQKSKNKDEKSLLNLIYNKFEIDLNSIKNLEKKDSQKVIALVLNLKVKSATEKERLEYSKSKLKLARDI